MILDYLMSVKAKLRYLRIAPRKVRLVADLIRGKSVDEAVAILNFVRKRSVPPMLKLLNQAVDSAVNTYQLKKEDLYISKILVDEGPKYKRWIPRAQGRTNEIQKKTSHITIVLDETKGKKSSLRKKVKSPKISETPKIERKKESLMDKEKISKEMDRKMKNKDDLKKKNFFRAPRDILKSNKGRGLKKIFKRKAI